MANLGNAYEQERELRILKNKEELRRLTQGCQLVTSAPALAAASPRADAAHYDFEAVAARRRQREEERDQALALARRSLRARGLEPVEESGTEMELRLRWAEEARAEAEKRRAVREAALADARARGEVSTRCGRPVTWIGGGGQDPAQLARMGVPELRTLFRDTFGQETASNNSAWLRKKLAEPPAGDGGARRAELPRARDASAGIWTRDEGGPSCKPPSSARPAAAERPGAGSDAARLLLSRVRPDACLLEAKAFLSSRTAGKAQRQPETGASCELLLAPWGAKRVRTAVARVRGEAQGQPRLQPPCQPLQLESAPTSDNEHDAQRAQAPTPLGCVEGVDEDALIDFPSSWAGSAGGMGDAWEGVLLGGGAVAGLSSMIPGMADLEGRP